MHIPVYHIIYIYYYYYDTQVQLTDLLCAITNRLHGKRPTAITSITTYSRGKYLYILLLYAFIR